MQDRFKFRIWDKKRQVIRDVWSVTPFGVVVNDVKTESYSVSLDDCVIMQCTGLKDKNGKLIYEGDILRVTGSQDTTGFGVVEYLQSGCQFNISGYLNKSNPYFPRRKGEYYQHLQEWLFTEIIGNIYENPELLEQ